MIIESKKYSPEEVFNMIGEEELMRNDDYFKKTKEMIVDGYPVYKRSLRYMTFYQKGLTCACCGKKGTYFSLRGVDGQNRRHFDLFSDDGTLFTKDHIIPASRGGEDKVSNMQTMCEPCNKAKGNSYEGISKHYIVATNIITNKCNKFSSIESAINNFLDSNKTTKRLSVISAVLKIEKNILNALQTGESYRGCTWSEIDE